MKNISKHCATRRNRKSGQAIVELALLSPVLFLLVLGVADYCRAFYASIAVTNAARAGAQYALRQKYTDTPGIKNAAVADAGLASFTTANVTPTYYCQCPGSGTKYPLCSNGGSALPCSGPMLWVDVSTSYTYTTIVTYPGVPHTTNLSGRAQMRIQ